VVRETPAGGDGVCIAKILAEKAVSLIQKLDRKDMRKYGLGKPIWCKKPFPARISILGQPLALCPTGIPHCGKKSPAP
jgi:hypothetical protein